jgi:hypothetical protein
MHDLVNERNDEEAAEILAMLKQASAEMSKINATLDEVFTKCAADAGTAWREIGPQVYVSEETLMNGGMILGSSIQPSMLEINGEQVQLGTIVAGAQARSFMTPKEWNNQSDEQREDRIAYHIDWLRSKADEQVYEIKEKPALLPAITVPLKNAKPMPNAYNPNSTTHIIPK